MSAGAGAGGLDGTDNASAAATTSEQGDGAQEHASGAPATLSVSTAEAQTETSMAASSALATMPYRGASGVAAAAADETKCPVCHEPIREAFMTVCGHSFCYLCITKSLDRTKRCPQCSTEMNRTQVFPNFSLNRLIANLVASPAAGDNAQSPVRQVQASLDASDLSITDINQMLSVLLDKKKKLEADEREVEIEVLLDFLQHTRQEKKEALAVLTAEISFLDSDIASVEEQRASLSALKEKRDHIAAAAAEGMQAQIAQVAARQQALMQQKPGVGLISAPSALVVASSTGDHSSGATSAAATSSSSTATATTTTTTSGRGRKRKLSPSAANAPTGRESGPANSLPGSSAAAMTDAEALTLEQGIAAKKNRVKEHFADLQQCYFDTRRRYAKSFPPDVPDESTSNALVVNNPSASVPTAKPTRTSTYPMPLQRFQENLSRFTKYSEFRVLSTLKYGDLFNSSSIVSSIEFDRDDEYFATAGVTKKIKIFEFNNILQDPIEHHYPVREMQCRSKVSCLSWSSYIKAQIASSDYEGMVSLWDAYTGQQITTFEEHDKRVWSVDFSKTDPTRLASGSDDTKVKIWSTNQETSVLTIDSKANVCCVRISPIASHLVAFGSADHHIHYYDLRRPREALHVFKGHRKAVSYVKFLNQEQIVSASTDSTLKLWGINQNECIRTFAGHNNEKNFVGLTTNGDFISCGSENNSVYTYYTALSKPIVQHKFNSPAGEDSDEDTPQFVSSVCWKRDSNILLAANSQGTIKVMELV